MIAARAEGKDGRPVYLISRNSMSRTTGQHLSYLRGACPCDYIRVPFEWGDGFYKPGFNMFNLLAYRFKEALSYDIEQSMKHAGGGVRGSAVLGRKWGYSKKMARFIQDVMARRGVLCGPGL